MILTDAERTRFAEWLRNEAASTKAIMEQAKKLNIGEVMNRRWKIELLACEIIAAKLEQTESVTIG